MTNITIPGLGAMSLSMDENIETTMSFFHEEIDRLTHDDEMTLMEIIEQASRKKRPQKDDPETRSAATRQSSVAKSTPPLAPRNSQKQIVRNVSKSSSQSSQQSIQRQQQQTYTPDRPRPRTDPRIESDPSKSSDSIPRPPYSADECSTSAIMGELDIARETFYDYGSASKPVFAASRRAQRTNPNDNKGLALQSTCNTTTDSASRLTKHETVERKLSSSQSGDNGDSREVGQNNSQSRQAISQQPAMPSVVRNAVKTVKTPDDSSSVQRTPPKKASSRSDESVGSHSSRSDPYGAVSARDSFVMNATRQSQQSYKYATPVKQATDGDDWSSVSHRARDEPLGKYAKQGPYAGTPMRPPDKQPQAAKESKGSSSLPPSSGNRVSIVRTSSAPMSAIQQRQPMDPPNAVEPAAGKSQTANGKSETPRPTASETEAWKSMIQLLRETLDRQEHHIRKLERENGELRQENKELRQESLRQKILTSDPPERPSEPHYTPPIESIKPRPIDASVDHYSTNMQEQNMEADDVSEQTEDWSLPHQLFIRRAVPDTRSYPDPKRERIRSSASHAAYSPPVPEMGRSERPPSPMRARSVVDRYGYPIHETRRTASEEPYSIHDMRRNTLNEQQYMAPAPNYSFSPGTQLVGDLSTMMHVKPDYRVPLSYMVDEYYERRHPTDMRDARSEMRRPTYR